MGSTGKIIVFAIIAVLVIGFIVYPKFSSTDDAPQQVASVVNKLRVNALKVKSEKLNNDLRLTGSLVANESVVLKAEVSARVEKINFIEGQNVTKGQLLVQLDDSEIQAEIAKLNFIKKLNEDNENRQKQLLEKEAISKEEYETALTTLNTTLADIKVKQVQQQKHQIRAPFDGIIGLRNVSQGSYISSADELVTLYSINPIKIDFSIPGKYSALVNPKDKIEFNVDSYEKEAFYGEIYAVEPQVDPKTRSLQARAKSQNRENKLLPGQFAKIRLTLDTFNDAIMIPTEAVIPELNGKKVFIYVDGKVDSRSIETGIRTADRIQVTSGLNAGDIVLTSGILQLKQGMEVDLNLGNE
ncbi:MAG TPA: efflux RND transporter periplasmic adaptor subunit [Fulvivirga sp.]|nr:efflux RND transporter periplasmic adaptor subunit [Fulvivirga sp.]